MFGKYSTSTLYALECAPRSLYQWHCDAMDKGREFREELLCGRDHWASCIEALGRSSPDENNSSRFL